jgi:hypothetical protein
MPTLLDSGSKVETLGSGDLAKCALLASPRLQQMDSSKGASEIDANASLSSPPRAQVMCDTMGADDACPEDMALLGGAIKDERFLGRMSEPGFLKTMDWKTFEEAALPFTRIYDPPQLKGAASTPRYSLIAVLIDRKCALFLVHPGFRNVFTTWSTGSFLNLTLGFRGCLRTRTPICRSS